MGFWEHFPYTNFHDLNLDWIVSKIGEIKSSVAETSRNKEDSAGYAASAERSSAAAAGSEAECRELVNEAEALYNNIGMQRRFVLIGDSYGVNTTRDNIAITGWCERVKSTMGFSDYLCTYYAKSGAGFAHGGTSGDFKYCLNQAYNNVEEPESVTDIVVLGGYNDWHATTTEISSAIADFVTTARQLFPAANVSIGFVGRRSSSAEQNVWRSLFYVYNTYSNAPCGYVENIEYACRAKQYFVSDGVHPNNDGETRIANALCSWIRGGYNGVDSSIFAAGSLVGNMSMDGSVTRLSIPAIALTGAQDATIDLGEITQGWVLSFKGWTIIPLTGTLRDSDGVWRNCTYYMTVTNDCHLNITPRCVKESGWVAPEEYVTISIPVQTVILPTMLC